MSRLLSLYENRVVSAGRKTLQDNSIQVAGYRQTARGRLSFVVQRLGIRVMPGIFTLRTRRVGKNYDQVRSLD